MYKKRVKSLKLIDIEISENKINEIIIAALNYKTDAIYPGQMCLFDNPKYNDYKKFPVQKYKNLLHNLKVKYYNKRWCEFLAIVVFIFYIPSEKIILKDIYEILSPILGLEKSTIKSNANFCIDDINNNISIDFQHPIFFNDIIKKDGFVTLEKFLIRLKKYLME